MTTVAAPEKPVPALVTADRCDRCGAQALARLVSQAGAILDFCGHHNRQHALAAMAQGFRTAEVLEGAK